MWSEMEENVNKKGIPLPSGAIDLFASYYDILIRENAKVNLTRITEEKEVMYKHVLDSLELLAWQPNLNGTLLDVGSGAGLPGLPLKIARPDLQLTLLDSSRKRVDFLQTVVEALQLSGVSALHGRAEDMARRPQYREAFSWVVSRAVAKLTVLCELCLPFAALGGYFIAYKGPDGHNELTEAENALHELGGRVESVRPYRLPQEMGTRILIIIKKERETPVKYPRKAGLPEKRPL